VVGHCAQDGHGVSRANPGARQLGNAGRGGAWLGREVLRKKEDTHALA
jgi:hypothetical protein